MKIYLNQLAEYVGDGNYAGDIDRRSGVQPNSQQKHKTLLEKLECHVWCGLPLMILCSLI
jgi:hypothetical protein